MIIHSLQIAICCMILAFPTLLACNFKHPQAARVALLNLLVGWTPPGWVILVMWVIATARDTAPARR